MSLMSPALAEGFFTTSTWEAPYTLLTGIKNGVGPLENSWADSYKTKHVPVMLLLLLSHFSRVRLCVTPETAAQQAPPSLGFSRQEHWSGFPFPSPKHGSEK